MARKRMYFSVEKAMRALGLRQTPVEQVLREAVDWFVVHAYAPAPPAYRTRVP
jgi:nucleoside-diphosphate-sugar epimerase